MIAFAAQGDGDKAGELFAILNPINHASTRSGLYRYKVEPYVMAGDVYSESPARGPRRLDLVHGRGRLDVPRGSRVDPGLPPARHGSARGPVHSARLAPVSKSSSATTPPATGSPSRTPAARCAA